MKMFQTKKSYQKPLQSNPQWTNFRIQYWVKDSDVLIRYCYINEYFERKNTHWNKCSIRPENALKLFQSDNFEEINHENDNLLKVGN